MGGFEQTMNSHSLGLGVCSKFPGVCDELMLSYQNRHFFFLRMESNVFIICCIAIKLGVSQKLLEVNSSSSVAFSRFRGRSGPSRCVENVSHEHSR